MKLNVLIFNCLIEINEKEKNGKKLEIFLTMPECA